MLAGGRHEAALTQDLLVLALAIKISGNELQDIGIASRVERVDRLVLVLRKMGSGDSFDFDDACDATGNEGVEFNASVGRSRAKLHGHRPIVNRDLHRLGQQRLLGEDLALLSLKYP